MTIDKSDQRVRTMFGEIAPRYDLMNHLLSCHVDRYWRWRTVRLARPQGQAPILDVCTGTGDLALAYHRRTRGEVGIFATDFCPQMLAVGEDKKRRAGINGNLTFLEADTQSLPFPDNTFQLVTVAFGLRNVADTDRGLSEMVRVCQPAGRVAILEFSLPRRQPIKALYGFYFRNILPRLGQWFTRSSHEAYSYLPQSVGEFWQGEALAQRMHAAGLQKVIYYPLTFGIATLYIGTK